MLTQEQNKLLTQTGPGTPMGNLMRRYWIPALYSRQLPEPDCPPLRVRLLGENLLAFRETTGAVGLIAEHCAHRGASLFFGRNEQCGIRCAYHGWKYDVTGQCVDMPSEPAESSFQDRIRMQAYSCKERGGVVWTFMGSADLQPAVPELEWTDVPDSHRLQTRRIQECNWLQALEGGFDPTHVSFLHRGYARSEMDTRIEVIARDYGLMIGQGRDVDGSTLWRVSQWLLPFSKMIPPRGVDRSIGFHAWVPIDDESCLVYSIDWHPTHPLAPEELENSTSFHDIHGETIAGTDRTVLNMRNDYMIDRELQRSGRSFTGIKGIGMQDSAIQESQGPIYDRSQEHLGASDLVVLAIRHRLLQMLNQIDLGGNPPGLDGSSYRVRGAAFNAPPTAPVEVAAADWVKAGM